jgi:hypothetical protein
MLDSYLLTLHGLTLRQLADAEQLADVIGLDRAELAAALEKAVGDGAAMAARGGYMITPSGRDLLDAAYPAAFAALRAEESIGAAMDAFEAGVNAETLAATTQWQLEGPDPKIVDRLHSITKKVARVLAPLAAADPLLERFFDRLGAALDRVDAGEHDYVSGVRVDSFHTVWFQMHEHVLRLTGRERPA